MLGVPWKRLGFDERFFERWRTDVVAWSTLVERLPQGDLYNCVAPFSVPPVWVVVGLHSVLVAYSSGETPEQIRECARTWCDALKARNVAMARTGRHGHPVYAAEYDPERGRLVVGWFVPGDWCGLAREPLSREWFQIPRNWPNEWRDRINQLAAERSLPPCDP